MNVALLVLLAAVCGWGLYRQFYFSASLAAVMFLAVLVLHFTEGRMRALKRDVDRTLDEIKRVKEKMGND